MKKILFFVVSVFVSGSVLANNVCPSTISCNVQPNNKTTCTGLDSSWKFEVDPVGIKGQQINMPLTAIQATRNTPKSNRNYLYCFYSGSPQSNVFFFIYQPKASRLGGNGWVPSESNPKYQDDCKPLSPANCYTE
ncbi:MAG: hypothetical protein A3E82_01265 [Gammaproteobacteria bacterium RIFCSPHIGHO2_12_FULL_38_11]|nr:MAG: hypothetical protein A3E82_01265 [Gammaproteobacteria bacterium RIFCSPHIGHO2_12_FULL_38_11]